MITAGGRVVDVMLWCLLAWFTAHLQLTETRMEEVDSKYKSMEPHTQSTENPKPEPPRIEPKLGNCFHMTRKDCPADMRCKRIEPDSVFCCDVDSFRLKEALAITMTQNTTNLHVLNATIDELDVSQSIFRRLTSMALTDGNIGKIIGQFPKHSSIACLNISNNNLSSATLQPPIQRPFAYLFNLTVLDASRNNLTEFPLSLVQSNRKISVDLSGNNYLPCKHFLKVMETNNSSLVTFLNYDKTFCALDLRFNWFKDVLIVPIDHLRVQKELNISCRNIRPADINCTCVPDRLELMDGVNNLVAAVDCSQRHLKEMPTNLPPNTAKLNVSYNNITSLQPVSDPSYEHVRQLLVDHNDIANIVELEGTKFIDNFMIFSITHNKLKTIHTYVLSNRFETMGPSLLISGNYIHCDCNTEKVLKPWLLENFKNIPDYKGLKCEDNMGAVVDLRESQVCHTPRDWTDYIYYIIGLEVLILVLLISKVSYDYWVFKTAGYLPWPANKMPRLPCDWLCE
ncbi:protein halfway [Pararge aegeria]|uniref:Jg11713 protein n=2 Tax=Pararge aegeria TaxID=116150 RepID=A0A8S4S3I8_9NEOP|nr:protein halfway [Pararge aegeria]CAH2244598.1 jg11713 [Pararge aegeria aegeria]